MATTLTIEIPLRRPARTRARALSALASTCAVILIVAVLAAMGREDAASRPRNEPDPSPLVGVFTGEFDGDAPVYRLPPVNVVGRRDHAPEPATRVGSARPAALM